MLSRRNRPRARAVSYRCWDDGKLIFLWLLLWQVVSVAMSPSLTFTGGKAVGEDAFTRQAYSPPRRQAALTRRFASSGDQEGQAWWVTLGLNQTSKTLETYRKVLDPKPDDVITYDDFERDVNVSFVSALSQAVFNAYVVAAPPAQAPDCTSYSATLGACCPSLECYRDLPSSAKIFVTGALLLAMWNGVKLVTSPWQRSGLTTAKCIFITAVAAQLLYTLLGP
eukprot:TRINITY_DN82694_c0_g1_i1.p1 TRINITY_DN82694_c0_g1~~TRINITY_DN82694_c0_g1_i1.p1  ORF type:complete len:224 (+),score=18.90 TRINITY_DN82694_c0_g1_i1:44-715(+)